VLVEVPHVRPLLVRRSRTGAHRRPDRAGLKSFQAESNLGNEIAAEQNRWVQINQQLEDLERAPVRR
jgi:hypothetical protein